MESFGGEYDSHSCSESATSLATYSGFNAMATDPSLGSARSWHKYQKYSDCARTVSTLVLLSVV
jgi:hypothetical protein